MSDPEQERLERHRAIVREYHRERMLNDPEWAEKRREKKRRYSAQPHVIAKKNAEARRRRAEDPEWAEKARSIEKASKSRPEARANQRIYQARWRLENLERERIREAAKRAARRASIKGTEVERIDRLVVYERDGGRCHICGKACSSTNFHIDHLVPLSRGGSHTYRNVAVAHASCNLRRGADHLPAQLRLVG